VYSGRVINANCTRDGRSDVCSCNIKTCTITNTRHATLTVNKVLSPAGDTGKFNLQIDSVTKAAAGGVGNGGTTGAIVVTAGVASSEGGPAGEGGRTGSGLGVEGDGA